MSHENTTKSIKRIVYFQPCYELIEIIIMCHLYNYYIIMYILYTCTCISCLYKSCDEEVTLHVCKYMYS